MIIAVAGQKGGSGKSTVALCVACELVARGKSVLLVDADPQQTVSTWCALAEEASQPGPTTIAMGATMHRPGQLDKVARDYDVTLIDCPPRHGEIQRSALMAADVAVLPCGPSPSDVWALATSIELVNEATTIRSTLRACILITKKKAQTVLGRSARDAMIESGLPVLKTELGDRIAYQETLGAGVGVTLYAPQDEAAAEIRSLTDELLTLGGNKDGKNRKARDRQAHQTTAA